MKTFRTMLFTEFKLSLRGMDMMIFAVCMPIVVLVLIGIIYGERPAFEGANYSFLEQSFGAITTISICAGGVMGLPLVVSEYRANKILKRYKVTPISPVLILIVQVAIFSIYSVLSLITLLITAKVFFGYTLRGSWLYFLGSYSLVIISMFSIGMMVGGIARNIKIANIITSLLYFPMIIFSGATLPYEVMPNGLKTFANILPLTQGIKLLKASTLGQNINVVTIPIVVMLILALICTFISIRFFRWE